jgi:hypothetical protein
MSLKDIVKSLATHALQFQQETMASIQILDNQMGQMATMPKFGVLSQATKNKTFTSKNICSSAGKGRSHEEYLA